MVSPLVSTLVITYNQRQYMPKLLMSLDQQTYKNQEIIISDDASEDNTYADIDKWVAEHDDSFYRITSAQHVQNLGGGGRGNIAFVSKQISSESRYVQICEGDDYLFPHKTRVCVDYLEANPQAVGVHGNFRLVYSPDHEVRMGWHHLGRPYIPSGDVYDILLQSNFVMTCTTMWRADVYKEAFDYDLFTKHKLILGDYAGTLRAARMGSIDYLDQELAYYRWNTRGTVNKPETRPQIVSDTVRLQQLVKARVI